MNFDTSKLCILTGNANPKLAEEVAQYIGVELCHAFVGHFNNGETQVMISDSIRGKDVFIIQPTSQPVNDNLMELLVMADACRRASAQSINAVVPYYAYSRQDRKTRGREPISAKLVANLMTTAGIDRVITVDLHAGQIQGFFDIPVDHLAAAPLLAAYIQAIQQAFTHINQAKLTQTTYFHAPQQIVIDCMHGATSDFAEALFSQLGYCCIMLNASPDGNFPQGNPDPTQSNRLTQLAYTVKATGSDIGLAFDGDGDRVMVIDAQGQMISPDNLLYLLARIAIEELPSTHTSTDKKVIFDVKCSHHVPNLIASHGAAPIMTKTGSSLMRKSLQNKSDNAIFAGELSGHFIFLMYLLAYYQPIIY